MALNAGTKTQQGCHEREARIGYKFMHTWSMALPTDLKYEGKRSCDALTGNRRKKVSPESWGVRRSSGKTDAIGWLVARER